MVHPEESPASQLDLERWLRAQKVLPDTQTKLVGDVSQRRYSRFQTVDGGSVVLALYPASLVEVCGRFTRTTGWLEELGVRVPRILKAACSQGWMLLEDLGPRTLYDLPEVDWQLLEPLFAVAVSVTQRIATLPGEPVAALNPSLDEPLLARELSQTWGAFLEPEGLLGEEAQRRQIERSLAELCARLGAETPVPCHRDLMARNLIALDESEPPALASLAVLDHQDLRLGPPGYDVASLLNDSLFPPSEVEDRLLQLAFGDGSRLPYHRAAAQRTLKAVGTYAVFASRGSDRHRPLIPPSLDRALHHLSQLPEMASLLPTLESLWSAAAGRS